MTFAEHDLDDIRAQRFARLRKGLARLDSLAVAFSGGVDSSVLLHAARARRSGSVSWRWSRTPPHYRAASCVRHATWQVRWECGSSNWRRTRGEDPRYQANAGDRCYFCKYALFDAMQSYALDNGIGVLAYGEIADELGGRPSRRAGGA